MVGVAKMVGHRNKRGDGGVKPAFLVCELRFETAKVVSERVAGVTLVRCLEESLQFADAVSDAARPGCVLLCVGLSPADLCLKRVDRDAECVSLLTHLADAGGVGSST